MKISISDYKKREVHNKAQGNRKIYMILKNGKIILIYGTVFSRKQWEEVEDFIYDLLMRM